MFLSSPILGTGYASFQYGSHTSNLSDTHNWFVKVLVETGIAGGLISLVLLFQLVLTGYRLFRQGRDPLYIGLGLGLLLSVVCCLIANLFGDRWTYLEITGLLWILAGSSARALMLAEHVDPAAFEPALTELDSPSAHFPAWPPGLRPSASGRSETGPAQIGRR